MEPMKLENLSVEECMKSKCFFWTDGTNVYYQRNQVPLKNANPEKMWCWKNFAFDDKRVFLRNRFVRGVSPVDFCVLNHAFVRTKSHVLTESGVIKCSMEDYVKVLDKGIWHGNVEINAKGYILVKEDVWYEGHWSQGLVKLTKVNAEKFVSLEDGVFGIDDERVYVFGKIVKGASAKDFKKVEDSVQCSYYTSNGYLYFRDKRMMSVSSIENISIMDGDSILVNGTKYYNEINVEEEKQ